MQIRTETWRSEAIGREKSITVLLPPSYTSDGPPCPVVYLLHGHGGNRSTWQRSVDLSGHLAHRHLIAVLPESGRYWFIDDESGRRYESYLVGEVVDQVDRRFNTVAARSGRGLGGFSMGGACSVFQTLRHPDRFAAAASQGGAFEAPLRVGDPYEGDRTGALAAMPTVAEHERVWGPVGSGTRRRYDPRQIVDAHDRSLPVELLIEIGTDDHPRMVSMSRNMHDTLVAAGMDHTYRERPGGHDWDFVNAGASDLFAYFDRTLSVP